MLIKNNALLEYDSRSFSTGKGICERNHFCCNELGETSQVFCFILCSWHIFCGVGYFALLGNDIGRTP
jgi:hypothetical protein